MRYKIDFLANMGFLINLSGFRQYRKSIRKYYHGIREYFYGIRIGILENQRVSEHPETKRILLKPMIETGNPFENPKRFPREYPRRFGFCRERIFFRV